MNKLIVALLKGKNSDKVRLLNEEFLECKLLELCNSLELKSEYNLEKGYGFNRLEEIFSLIKSMDIKCVTLEDEEYPQALKEIFDPPFMLYVRGSLSALNMDLISIVGTRKPSLRGYHSAFKVGMDLGRANIGVVSGLALGIDGAAHSGNISTGGNTVAVLGSGIMGSGIACHLANVDMEVLLLDMVPRDKESETDKNKRNSLVDSSLKNSVKSKPSPVFTNSKLKNITTGNFTDDFEKINDYDWIIEVVVERLDIKKIIFEKVDQFRKEGSLVSSNTSGIPINSMLENRSEDFKKHFFGSHFFNPVRYLRLLEIIPTKDTKIEIIDFMTVFGEKILGKSSVLCKDTPGFIANRIGVFAIQELFHTVKEMGLSVGEVDLLTGPIMGRQKSATFRTCDVVGLDTLIHVANGLKVNCPRDERNKVFEIPDFIQKMRENNWLGSKTGQGFYKKSVDENGKRNILELNLLTLEYSKNQKSKLQ